MPKVGFVSLGCPKNLVDSEVMLGVLTREGYEITTSPAEADVIVINTCAFIDEAKEESIETVLEMAAYKEHGRCRRLVVAGCLVERYRDEIREQLPEVDALVGVNEIKEIARACRSNGDLPVLDHDGSWFLYSDRDPRILATPGHTAYVKIAEGCDHPCTFCVIPRMRGPFRSRRAESVVAEVIDLSRRGVREVNLVAQDSTMYGWDHGDRRGLANLLDRLDKVDGVEWIRVLYLYPTTLYDELLDIVADSPKVCKYIDMPLQSASQTVLQRMKRGGNRRAFLRMLERIRERIPGVVLRSTFIVGFPGESEEDFEETLEFVEEARFDRLGVFTYSDEEEAASHRLDGAIPVELRRERRARLMEAQKRISLEKNRAWVGRTVPVLLEGPSAETDLLWQGRMQGQAPEIDGVVYLNDGITPETRPGDIRRVLISEAYGYDLVGAVVP